MRKVLTLVVLLTAFALAISAVWAQDPTGQPTTDPNATGAAGEATQDMMATDDMGGMQQGLAHIRIAYLAPNAASAAVYLNGEPTTIQALAYPSVTGWVEVPAEFNLAIVPGGATVEQASIGPANFSLSNGQWITIAVVGSADAVQAYAIEERVGRLAPGCTRLTVFNAISGSAGFDILDSGGAAIVPQMGLSQGDASTDQTGAMATAEAAMGAGLSSDCATRASQLGQGMTMGQATAEAGATSTDAQGAQGESMSAMSAVTPLNCRQVFSDANAGGSETDTMATAEAGMMATAEAGMMATTEAGAMTTAEAGMMATSEAGAATLGAGAFGSAFSCAYTLDVPAGIQNFTFATSGGDGTPIGGLGGIDVVEGTQLFVALFGDAASPQILTATVLSSQLFSDDTGSTGGGADASGTPGATTDPAATAGATTDATTTATVNATATP